MPASMGWFVIWLPLLMGILACRSGEEAAAISLPGKGRAPTAGGEDLFARATAFVSQRPFDAGPLFLFLDTYSVHDCYKQRPWALAKLELTGTPPIADPDGRSFAALLRGEPLPAETRSVCAMEHYHVWSEEGARIPGAAAADRPIAVAVIEGPHGYIRGLWSEELYDMRTDRWQRRNLAPEAGNLDAYRRLIARRSGRQVAPTPIERDPELIGQLRSLGYAE